MYKLGPKNWNAVEENVKCKKNDQINLACKFQMQLPQYADSWSVKMTAPTIEGVHCTVL